jgi:hypothetical protein
MGSQPDQIKRHIEIERERLGENLQTLESRVRRAGEFRTWVDAKPLTLLGLAFGAGIYLATKLGR